MFQKFQVIKSGRVGIDTNAKLELTANKYIPETLYYRLVPVFENDLPIEKEEVNVDTDVLNGNQIDSYKSVYSGLFEVSNEISYGIIDNGEVIQIDNNPILGSYDKTGKSFNESDVKILCPNPNPSKSLCLALNYGSHLGERGAPTRPEPFYKTSTALIGPGDAIKIHPEAGLVACESELVAIIGKVTKNVLSLIHI